jgi:hypothetical protein
MLLAAALTGSALANAPQGITAGEVALLPPYCPDTQTFTLEGSPDSPTQRQARWVGMLGRSFWDLHHYCWALINTRRATMPGLTRAQRDHLHRWAIGDALYVIRFASPDFALLPELWHRIGLYQMQVGDPIGALESFNKSREAKPDYWPPYVEIARIQQSIGRQAEALKVIHEGLVAAPGTPQLVEARAHILGSKAQPKRALPRSPDSPARAASAPVAPAATPAAPSASAPR